MQVPLATGESLYTRFEFLELMAAQGADIIQPDVCVCGGLLEMRKIAAIAEAHYVTMAPHNPMQLRDTPGLGIDVDEESVKDNEVVHWQRTCYVRPDGSTGYI